MHTEGLELNTLCMHLFSILFRKSCKDSVLYTASILEFHGYILLSGFHQTFSLGAPIWQYLAVEELKFLSLLFIRNGQSNVLYHIPIGIYLSLEKEYFSLR